MISDTNVLIFSLLSGIVPALFWLWFWIREDRLKPEPKFSLLSSFLGGIIAVLLALFFELIAFYLLADADPFHIKDFPEIFRVFLQNIADNYHLLDRQNLFWENLQDRFRFLHLAPAVISNVKKVFLVVIIAPLVEESLKLILTYNICLRRKVNDEPIDASIYLLTAALGFAAVETALILYEPLSDGHLIDTLIAGNFRSIGPMLIHLVSSAMLGIFIGLAFYKSKIQKFFYSFAGLVIAIILHSLFNLFIILNDATQNITFFWVACLGTWILVVVLLIFFERVKKVVRKI